MRKPIFVDLFYAVVVGSAIPQIVINGDIFTFLFKMFLIVIVLEDWHMYYSSVITVDPSLLKYKFRSLLIEFSILTSWYFSFTSYPKDLFIFLFLLGLYFMLRFLAGLSHYKKEDPFHKWKIEREYSFLIPGLIPFAVLLLGYENISVIAISIIILAAWSFYVICWWYICNGK